MEEEGCCVKGMSSIYVVGLIIVYSTVVGGLAVFQLKKSAASALFFFDRCSISGLDDLAWGLVGLC